MADRDLIDIPIQLAMGCIASSSFSFEPWPVGGINDEYSSEEAREERPLNEEVAEEGHRSGATIAKPPRAQRALPSPESARPS
ncbi:hypothetical protein Nepgr_019799 [Nepenthes gracilis]|uniref:Uncharacterized protein n=1 Tax=Nepenthes gracilis TaxID=150966 RepID=A0AAD3SU26_NEPGR|nr:hypothetical protein Nepgr_019799 [Nepenthes gracilis]